MLTIIAAVVLALLAIATFLWALNGMLTHYCPSCAAAGLDESVIPVLPFFRWWCPSCSKVCAHSEVIVRELDEDGADDNAPKLG